MPFELEYIENKKKYLPILFFLFVFCCSRDFWIGLRLDESQLPDYEYIYEDGMEADFFVWDNNVHIPEPNNQNNERCIRMHVENTYMAFRTKQCNDHYSFVCEILGKRVLIIFNISH